MAIRNTGLRSTVSPTIEMEEIVIKLSRHLPPEVELRGRVRTGNRFVDGATSVTLKTLRLPPSGAAFIRDMRAMLGNEAMNKENSDAPPAI